MLRVAALAAAAVSVEAQFLPAPGTVGGGSRTITLQQYSSPDCAKGSESANPFAPPASAEDAKRPQSATLAFGVCFKDPRVANLNDNPDTKFDEHRIYSFLPKYMKLECNADGTVTKLTYNDASCSGPEVDDQTVTTQLIQAMLSAEIPGAMLSQLPPSAVTIQSPSNNLRPDVCYEEFSIDFSSLGDGSVGVISLSTKYKELGHCEPAIAGAGTITTTDYDNAECSDEGDHSDAKGGAGGDAPNTAAVQFGICFMDPDFQDVVDDPDTPFDESTIGDYLPAYKKLICNADGSVTQNQYFLPDCTGVEADEGAAIRELFSSMIRSETGQTIPQLEAAGAKFDFPVPDTITNGACIVEATMTDLPGGKADQVAATKYEYTGCTAATAQVANVGSETFSSINCAEDTLNADSRHSTDYQFGICAPFTLLNNLVDDPDTPFDETSAGTYLPEYQVVTCNDDKTVSIDYYEEYNCVGTPVDMGAALQNYMSASFESNYHVTLAALESQGAVMQFQTPDKITNGQCYPLVQMDLSAVQKPDHTMGKNTGLGIKYRIEGCPPAAGGEDGSTPAATCDEHMVTVLSAQVTTACCPVYDPNCGIPTYCSSQCAPVFNNFWNSCQEFIDAPELSSFHDSCVVAAGGSGH